FLLAHRELLVAVREAAFHADEPLNRVGQGALPLSRELLALEERLDLGLGFLEVTGKVHVEPPDAVLVVLDRLLAVVQGPGPFLDAPFLGGPQAYISRRLRKASLRIFRGRSQDRG